MKRRASCLVSVLALLGATAFAQVPLRNPQSVRSGLDAMDQVVDSSARLIDAKSYDALPRESAKFEQALTTLQSGLGEPQPADFKQKLGPLLAKARVASSAMSEAARTHNEPMILTTHRQLAWAVKSTIELFPADLQPKSRPGS